MKVILLAVAYPPDPHVGGLRAAKVAGALQAAGHEVEVITARLKGETSAVRARGPGLTVRTVRPIPHPRHGYLWIRDRIKRRRISFSPPSAEAESRRNGGSSAARWKDFLLSILGLPDNQQGFILPAVWRAWRAGRGADFVYTTTPPHSTHLAGLILKRLLGARWIAEFRDPWYVRATSPAVRRVEKWIRAFCLRNADHAVAVSEGTRDTLLAHAPPAAGGHVVLARNGIEPLGGTGTQRDPALPLRFAYVGTLYLGRDPAPFLGAVAALRRRHSLTNADVQIDLVGWCETFNGRSVQDMTDQLGVGDLIRFHGLVPHERASELIQGSDLLILLAQGRPLQVPNKLYEYLGARKPILAFVDEGGESARMLRNAGSHYLVTTDDPGAAEAAVERAWRDLHGGRRLEANEQILQEWSTSRQMEILLHGLGLHRDPVAKAVLIQ